jgi:hypothetical protein
VGGVILGRGAADELRMHQFSQEEPKLLLGVLELEEPIEY